ncbi:MULTISPECIES: EAL domain-containing response regulator [Pseudoalteromonas]|uniref:EAL domain-containing response regulator n=1 Tax=Pseudoalteromonas TaxID=53246 RepID=UPI000381A441|nr:MULTISPECIES: EAL domain-containing response regulator [Pseudoalteromonas]MCF6146282.1 c-di-GMP phosphodiesterase [Pseudoalteromonas mariniglutinosa NCIMB 1770]
MFDSSMHILIVDDHAFVRRALTSMINQLGDHQVTHANDGDEALKLINTLTPDIIICDLAMPNMDGLALLRQLSAQKFAGSVILSSASDASLLRAAANLVNAFGLNLLGIMPKPSSHSQLSHFFNAHQNRFIQPTKQSTIKVDTQKGVLQQALAQGQFIAVYQPQVDFKSGDCIGLEALCRWQHPELGLLSPYFFIDQIEDAGLMPALTLSIIEQSVTMLEQLPAEFSNTKLSINLTPSCLSNETVSHILADQPLMALAQRKRISLEVTEQTELLSDSLSLELLSRLRMNGFNLSVDDFGTGYSSLQQLSQYPFNEIKLDRSFVTDALNDPQSGAIVEMAIQLAKKLHMKVVVEGVETFAQWQHMQLLGADTCQGFYCAKPMHSTQLATWNARWQSQYQAIKVNADEALRA